MAKIINFFRIIRNNWKKSMVGTAALSYGISYSKEHYETEELMRKSCEQVQKYGDAALPTNVKPRHVTIILNPAAKKRKAKKLFEKYCEPLLHLAGIAVTIVQTESGGQARTILMNLETPTDAIIVAGGDGTVSDVLTGLMRKYNTNLGVVKQCPIGILPLGETNSIGNRLYTQHTELADVERLIAATMAVINETTELVDSVEIETVENNPDEVTKPVYAMGSIEWGAWRDAQALSKKYWYWGPLKQYMTYVFSGYKKNLSWDCSGIIKYTEPCNGCSSCYQKKVVDMPTNKRWWHAFVRRRNLDFNEDNIDYSKIINENCGIIHEMPVKSTDVCIKTLNVDKSETQQSQKSLNLYLGPTHVDYPSFVSEGWNRVNETSLLRSKLLEAKTIELLPEQANPDRILYVDNEEYELKPIKVKLLPRSVKVFCPTANT